MIYFALFILLPLAFCFVFYWLVPKGNLIHEGLRIPGYNWKLQTTPINNIQIETHKYGKHRRQYFLFIEPTDQAAHRDKIVVYYHGGGWMFGSPRQFILNATFFTTRGYTVIMPCYRCLPRFRFPTIRKDLNLAWQEIGKVLESKNLGHKDFLVGGMSAGANLAALVKYDQEELQKISLAQDKIAGLMLFAGPLNLHEMDRTPLLYAYAGSSSSSNFHKASPIQFLEQQHSHCPVLMVHGTKDGLVRYKNSTSFYEALQNDQNGDIVFHTIRDGTHLDAGKWLFQHEPTKTWVQDWLNSYG